MQVNEMSIVAANIYLPYMRNGLNWMFSQGESLDPKFDASKLTNEQVLDLWTKYGSMGTS